MKRYALTYDDVINLFGGCDCNYCLEEFEKKFTAKAIPDWATHVSGPDPDSTCLCQNCYLHQEIPK